MNKNVVQRLARQFMHDYNLTPTIDLNKAARSVNAMIIEMEMPIKYSGACTPPFGEFKEFVIGVNTNRSIGHQRFTIAHEIGHIVMGHPQEHGPIFFSAIENFMTVYPLDRDANVFAAELLMPSRHLKSLVYESGLRDVEKLCRLYQVSKAAMEIKLQELGVVSSSQECWSSGSAISGPVSV